MSYEEQHPSNLSPSPDGLPPCPTFVRKPGAPFPPEVRDYALLLVASGMKRTDVARRIGGTEETLRLWVNAARETGTMPAAPQAASAAEESDPPAPAVPQRAPVDPGQGLGAHEQAGILEIKKRHPSMGPAQIRAQLKRFKGWRISVRAIARVLKQHGYELVHTGGRPKDEVVYANRILGTVDVAIRIYEEEVTRFEAPHRNALWQKLSLRAPRSGAREGLPVTVPIGSAVELRIGAERRALLIVEDDFSRFCVGHRLLENPTSEDVVALLSYAIRRHGKPEAIYTDRLRRPPQLAAGGTSGGRPDRSADPSSPGTSPPPSAASSLSANVAWDTSLCEISE